MRYRGTIYVDIFEEGKQDAEEQFEKIVLGLNNAFSGELVKMPHGSEVSFTKENDPTDRLLSPRGVAVK